MTPSEIDNILKYIASEKPRLEHNNDVLCILEGELLKFVEAHFRSEFTEADSVNQVLPRISPINFLSRIIDKLSKIYQTGVKRTIIDGNDQDTELIRWYENVMQIDAVMNVGNEYFNTFKTNLNQLFISKRLPKLRSIPNDRFLVYSDNQEDPTVPTHVIMPMGSRLVKDSRTNKTKNVDEFVIWTDEEAVIVDSDGDQRPFFDSGETKNPLGLDVFMYVNKSRFFLMPPMDTDTKRMTVLLAVLLSDLNYAAKFQSFSIMYGIDVNDEGLKMKPNSFWTFKSDSGTDKPPQLGQLTPQAQIQQILQLVATELGMWLNSRNIRPGSIGNLTSDNMSSGISKIVDEADTSDERKKQVEFYKAAEEEWWNGLMHNIHPQWVAQGLIDQTMLFSQNARISVEFPPQIPLQSRGDLVRDLMAEVEAGFLSRDTAMLKLNPDWGETELEAEKEKIGEQFEVISDGGEVEEN